MMVDASGLILMINTETEKLFGYRRQELIGRSIEILVPPRYRSEFPKYRELLRSDPQAWQKGQRGEFIGLRKDSTEIPIEIGVNPIQMQDGSYVILGVINDASQYKRNEQKKDELFDRDHG
jgi:PAS domain S-box-containing protein